VLETTSEDVLMVALKSENLYVRREAARNASATEVALRVAALDFDGRVGELVCCEETWLLFGGGVRS